MWTSVVTHCPSMGDILNQVASFCGPEAAQDDYTLVEAQYQTTD
jgi:hypothetical protein